MYTAFELSHRKWKLGFSNADKMRTVTIGDDHLFAIWELPDNVTVAAVSLMVNASGTRNPKVTVLHTPEEVYRAIETNVDFSLPKQ